MPAAGLQHWLFAMSLLCLALVQRRNWGMRGGAVLAAEFGAVGAVSGLGDTWVRLAVLVPYAVAFTLDYRFHDRLGWPLDKHILRFAMREAENARLLLASEFGVRGWAVLTVAVGTACASALAPPAADPALTAGFAGACLLLLALALPRAPEAPPVPSLARAVLSLLDRTDARPGLGTPAREAMPGDGGRPGRSLNILVVICESLGARALNGPEGRAATPRYHGFLTGERERVVEFPFALANSTSSDIAYVSLLSGVSPDASWYRFHANPLLWHAAKAKGHRTYLFSSQSLRWANLDRFLVDAALDRAVYREVMDAPAVNDLAMDDRMVNRHAIDALTREAGPFFAVVNYNMLHAPFAPYAEPAAGAGKTATERYRLALGLFDACFGDLVDGLRAAGKLESTVILLTADHGERPGWYDHSSARRMPGRLDDFNPDLLRIPFWVRLPDGAVTPGWQARLRANARGTVANLDLYPTVLDLLGYDGETRARFADGRSLMEPAATGRPVVMLNTCAFRQWALEPFAFARDGMLLIFHDHARRFELLRLDERDGADLWPALPESARRAWLAELVGYPAFADILARRRLASPPATPAGVARHYDGLAALGPDADLHALDNWGLFSRADWEEFCARTAEFIGVAVGDAVFEAGCGAGAFLDVLIRRYGVRATGVDISARLVGIAGRRLVGDFRVADIVDLSEFGGGNYDKVLSHGVFLYLPSLAAVRTAATELVRLVKPGGVVYIGLLNDPRRLAGYRSEHPPSGNAFVTRDFWHGFADALGLDVEVVDQGQIYRRPSGYDAHAELRYSVRLIKPPAHAGAWSPGVTVPPAAAKIQSHASPGVPP